MKDEQRFLKIYSFVLIGAFGVGLYSTYQLFQSKDFPVSHVYFIISLSLWYLITAIGILTKQKWGYYLFKIFLYALFLGFPIGSIISYKSLVYMKQNNIKNLFNQGTCK